MSYIVRSICRSIEQTCTNLLHLLHFGCFRRPKPLLFNIPRLPSDNFFHSICMPFNCQCLKSLFLILVIIFDFELISKLLLLVIHLLRYCIKYDLISGGITRLHPLSGHTARYKCCSLVGKSTF